jgi:PKD repeat protein
MKLFFLLVLSALSLASFGSGGADFTAAKLAGCPPLVDSFTDISTINATAWQWDFGNGNTSTLQNPHATFLTSGTYRVTLTVSNGSETDSYSQTITVYQLPLVNFTVNKPNACFGDTIVFNSNITTYDAPITQYAWGFGNGLASSDSAITYVYPETGAYSITLVVQDSVGCTANKTITDYVKINSLPKAAFTASPATSCQASQLVTFTNQSTGNGLAYSWQLDSSTSTANVNPTHLYQQQVYNVKLNVTDANGCKSAAAEKISVVELSADFVASNLKPCTGQKVQFTNTSNVAGSSWFWDFGDGTTSAASSPTKAYSATGTYTVKFKIMESTCADSMTKTAYITVRNGFTVSTATFSADTNTTCGAPLNVNFTNTTPGGTQYHWSFGNGDTSNLQNPSMLFDSTGNFTVSLTVTDSSGCSVSGTIKNFIQTGRPTAQFASDTITCLGGATQFRNLSTNA